MRFLALMLAAAAVAGSAAAQSEDIGMVNRGDTATPSASLPSSSPNGPGMVPAMRAAGAASNSTVVLPSAPGYGTPNATPGATDASSAMEDIGYDAKVRRDPNGNVIDDSKTPAAAPVAQAVRNDNKLTGDAAMFNKKSATPAPTPSPAAPVTNADLLKQMQEMQKNKGPNFPSAITVQGGQAKRSP